MDQVRTGELIRRFRTELGLTQKELAERIHISDKAVSKWECGAGCPDVSLLLALAEVFGTDVQVLLSGEIDRNESEKGNMKKLKFYVCKTCGNIVTSTSEAAVTCCGNRLTAMEPRKAEESEQLTLEDLGGEWYVTAEHPMTKEHYISFVAYQTDSCVMLFKQYPEWQVQVHLPLYRSGRLVWYCTECGLLYQNIRRPVSRA
ncbi:MAG: helix-turn-helix domain-containing protein [Oscillospiraceae bacterium]|nr:helix-turn-helix domain-containing protein [Oscillospiraceae bacterium]